MKDLKKERELKKDLEESEATHNKKIVIINQTEILKTVFIIYFRILKKLPSFLLLFIVLKGVSRFLYFINLDF